MSAELSPESDLLRLRREREARRGERQHVRCRRCRKLIPECKRADAVYCSKVCKRSYRWERRNELVREVRLAVRNLKVVPVCPCGAELNTTPRPGPVPKFCKRCYAREAMRQWRASHKLAHAKEIANEGVAV